MCYDLTDTCLFVVKSCAAELSMKLGAAAYTIEFISYGLKLIFPEIIHASSLCALCNRAEQYIQIHLKMMLRLFTFSFSR